MLPNHLNKLIKPFKVHFSIIKNILQYETRVCQFTSLRIKKKVLGRLSPKRRAFVYRKSSLDDQGTLSENKLELRFQSIRGTPQTKPVQSLQ